MSQEQLLAENRQRGWERVAETAPAWVRERIIAFRASVLAGLEFRMSVRQVQEAETRSALSAKVRSFAKRIFRPAASEDAELRRRLAETAEQIRVDAINDKSCTAVKLGADGKFYRDADARRKERIANIRKEIAEIGEGLGL